VVTGVGYGHIGYYGKREAEPYTIGQVAHGPPIARNSRLFRLVIDDL